MCKAARFTGNLSTDRHVFHQVRIPCPGHAMCCCRDSINLLPQAGVRQGAKLSF